MKLAFSTLGCPGWSFKEIFAAAKDLGLNGIEIRGIENEMYAPLTKAFSESNFDETLNMIQNSKVRISMLTSGACIGGEQPKEAAIKEICDYIDLACNIGTKFVRVMISSKPYPEEANLELAKEIYEEVCKYGEEKAVTPLIETNGVFCDTKKLRDFMDSITCANKGVLWDIHHPFRFNQESPQQSSDNLNGYVKYVHVKDSIMNNNEIKYRMMGYGDVPVLDALHCLKNHNYDSYVSLEWVKRWNPDLQEPGVVFSHFLSYMSYLLNQI